MTSRDFWRNNGNTDKQWGCFHMTRAEDGKLLSHLEWPTESLDSRFRLHACNFSFYGNLHRLHHGFSNIAIAVKLMVQ